MFKKLILRGKSGILLFMSGTRRNPKVLEELFASGKKIKYEKGEMIIRQEETPQGVFFIESGFVKSFDITKYGEENLLVIRESGQLFPILWTMTDERTDVFYQAMSDVELYKIDRRVYTKKIKDDHNFVDAVLGQVLEMYRVHSQRILTLEYRSAGERIAHRLLALTNRFGEKYKGKIIISVPLRHHDIASSVNCSRETASRELSKLEKKGYISSVDGQIIILNKKKLKSIVRP